MLGCMDTAFAISAGLPLAIPEGSIDLARELVIRNGTTFALTPLEGKLLRFLIEQDGALVSKERLLQEVWGYRATVQSRAVDKTLHRLRQKIEVDADSPQVLITVAGEGLKLRLGSAQRGPARALFQPPPRFEEWIGELESVERVVSALAADRSWVTLVGPGGSGKTRLSLEASARNPSALFVDLAAARTPEGALAVWATELGCVLGPDTESLVLSWLNQEPRWIVLDNLEQLVPAIEPVLSRWRAALPQARWLVTSRKPIGVPGERLIEVPPLSLSQAGALFAARHQGQASPEPGVLERLLERLEGLPLAIELAAARHRSVSVGEMLARWEEADRWLSQDRRPGPERHRGLGQTIDWSLGLLSEDERRSVLELSVFCGAFDLPLLESFWPMSKDQCLTTLDVLVDNHLVRPTGDGLFCLHQVVKVALHRRCTAEDLARSRVQHARAFRTQIKQLSSYSPRWVTARADLQLAVDTSLEQGWLADAAALGRVLGDVYWMVGPVSEGPEVLGRIRRAILAAAPDQIPEELIYFEASFLRELGKSEQSIEAVSVLPESSPYKKHLRVRHLIALGESREAQEVLATITGDVNPELRCAMAWTEAVILSSLGDVDAGQHKLRDVVDQTRRAKFPLLEGLAVSQLAGNALRNGHLDLAERYFNEAIVVYSAIRSLPSEADVWDGLGIVSVRRGDFARAVELHRKAIGLHQRYGSRRLEAVAQANLGSALHRLGDLEGAQVALELGLSAFRAMGRRDGMGKLLMNLARLLLDRGDRERARALAQEVVDELAQASEAAVVSDARQALQTW